MYCRKLEFYTLVVFAIVAAVLNVKVYCQDTPCCWKASGSCRTACEKMSLATIAADPHLREQTLQNLYNFCPQQFTNFWECMNDTVNEIRKGEDWSGRQCCRLPQSGRCQRACITAANKHELFQSCRQSDELSFFSCLDRQEYGDECCSNAVTSACQDACKAIFKSTVTPNREARNAIAEHCSDGNPKVIQCVKNYTNVTPATNIDKYLHCCDKGNNPRCKESCKRTLKSKTTGQEIVDALQDGGCGPPLPHDKLWQCFLQTGAPSDKSSSRGEISRIDRMGMDSAKLHCCNKASTSSCRRLCMKTFSDEWTKSWKEFDRECLSQLSEDDLLHCIEEVEEPCELGCDGLSYCTNFNNRPTELFRSCNSQADEAARYDIALWQQQGYMGLPAGVHLLVRNISSCSPDMWKAVACALQIKPCHRQSHGNRICREDCYEMLTRCMDWPRMPPGQTAASICSRLSSSESPSAPCISLKAYLEPSEHPYVPPEHQVTAPCKGDPCDPDEMCIINRNCLPGKSCRPYTCVSACKMGEVSQYMVPKGSYVRIPLASENKGCQKICQCSSHGVIDKCQPMPCVPNDNCWLGNKKIEHGSWFHMDCNVCSCYAGEITCSKKQCEMSALGVRNPFFTSLPCNCPPHHVPVCGRNGNTYPSSCLAKCAGLRDADFEFGPCSGKDPCESDPCGEGLKCVPVRKRCLSLLEKPCRQYVCVDMTLPCADAAKDPVCDSEQKEHPNLCYLLRSGKILAYKGPCLLGCRTDGQVCGIDGESYSSECAAKANRVAVDYRGGCIAVGLISESGRAQCGPAVACRPLPANGCMSVTPPGACCPICAGALRLLYSRKQMDRALYALKGTPTNSLTVTAILESLERQIQVAECSLLGFLTVELDIFVAVVSHRGEKASDLQREVCVREAEKLASLIRTSSPRLHSELGLSSLIAATLVHVMANSGSTHFSTLILLLILPLINFFRLRLK